MIKECKNKMLNRNPIVRKIYLKLGEYFLKRKLNDNEIKFQKEKIQYKSKIMRAVMVDDVQTDDSMKDINLDDLNSDN
jgi:hypothetical protein